jgi:hypothetical protein
MAKTNRETATDCIMRTLEDFGVSDDLARGLR